MKNYITTKKTYNIKSLSDWDRIALALLDQAGEVRLWAFYGDLGVGKTTLIRSLCKHLDVIQPVTSPTFNLVHEYQRKDGTKVFHCDFFRLNSVMEGLEIGLEEYLAQTGHIFIEWAEVVTSILPLPYFSLEITGLSARERSVFASVIVS